MVKNKTQKNGSEEEWNSLVVVAEAESRFSMTMVNKAWGVNVV